MNKGRIVKCKMEKLSGDKRSGQRPEKLIQLIGAFLNEYKEFNLKNDYTSFSMWLRVMFFLS